MPFVGALTIPIPGRKEKCHRVEALGRLLQAQELTGVGLIPTGEKLNLLTMEVTDPPITALVDFQINFPYAATISSPHR